MIPPVKDSKVRLTQISDTPKQWGTLISADASRLYHTSNRINKEFDKKFLLNNAQNSNQVIQERENLQSRLLERISNKKRESSPREIFLEEELSSSEEEEEEKNQ